MQKKNVEAVIKELAKEAILGNPDIYPLSGDLIKSMNNIIDWSYNLWENRNEDEIKRDYDLRVLNVDYRSLAKESFVELVNKNQAVNTNAETTDTQNSAIAYTPISAKEAREIATKKVQDMAKLYDRIRERAEKNLPCCVYTDSLLNEQQISELRNLGYTVKVEYDFNYHTVTW